MMEELESLPDYERGDVEQLVNYMHLRKVDPARYRIGPEAHIDAHAGVAAAERRCLNSPSFAGGAGL